MTKLIVSSCFFRLSRTKSFSPFASKSVLSMCLQLSPLGCPGRPASAFQMPQKLLSQPDWLGFQADGEARCHRCDDLIAQGSHLGCTGATAIDQSKRMAAGDSSFAKDITLGKAGPLDQPGSGELYLALLRRIGRDALLLDV